MKPARFLANYGLVLVLMLLCALFSALTFSDQTPTGEAAAGQIASQLHQQFGQNPRVLIAVRDQADEAVYAAAIQRLLSTSGAQLPTVVRGDPKDAREALRQIATLGSGLDAIVCTKATGAWLVFSDLKADFPSLGEARVITPRSYRWPNFLKTENLLNIANQIAVIAIVAIGMTMVIITGGIDLSVGSLLALSAVLTARFIRDFAGGTSASVGSMVLACLAAIALCGGIGTFSGIMITRFAIPAFIMTLAMMLVGSGLAYILANGQSIYQIPECFVWLGRGAGFFNLPNAVLLMGGLYGLAHILMSRMKLGRYLYAVGGNSEAARLSGVPVKRVLLFAYIASAMLAGLGGVIMASQLKSGSPTYGGMYELYVIAAVVVGGTSLKGGEGRMFGTLAGAFTIAIIQNGMNLANVESYTQKVVLGVVILVAVLVDRARHTH